MPQNGVSAYVATNPSNAATPMQIDATGNLLTAQGSSVAHNITAATVVKTGSGRVLKVINNAGTAGFVLSDLATTSGAAAANEIITIATTTVGQVINIDCPFTTGLAVTTVGASGRLVVIYD